MIHLRRVTDGELLQEVTVRRLAPPNIAWLQLLQPERSQAVELKEEEEEECLSQRSPPL